MSGITMEMQNAGGVAANEVCLSLFLAKWNTSDAEQIACAAYRAMHAAAPVELCPEDRIAALKAECAALRGEIAVYLGANIEHIATIDALRQEMANRLTASEVYALLAANARAEREAREMIAARDARIAELDSELARRPAPVPEPPKHNPFRDFSGDRRRVGA